MSHRDFRLPDVGEGLTEAEIVRWLVSPGDSVTVNQPLVEIETAKAVVELPCPVEGEVGEILVGPGQLVPVGTSLVTFLVADGDQPRNSVNEQQEGSGSLLVGYGVAASGSRRRRTVGAGDVSAQISHSPAVVAAQGRARTKPPVRQLARRLGVDVHALLGSGPNGVVTRDDVHRAASGGAPPRTAVVDLPGDERIDLTAVGRAMADAMVRSVSTAPHATVWLDVDVSHALDVVRSMRLREDLPDVRVTPLTVVAWALTRVAMKHRAINAAFDAATNQIVLRADVNLGIAVASPRGLVVPNIKAAQHCGLPDMARAITSLTDTAREGRTSIGDLSGGTITITNVGVFGVDGGTPILNPGEAAILAAGRVIDRPWVVNGQIVVRPVMQLSLSFDHRLVDGALGCVVLSEVAALLGGDASNCG